VSGSVLAGRAAEQEALIGTLDAVTGGDGRLVVLRGEAGIGKSRLLHEVRLHAAARHFDVFDGRCSELERDVPLAAIIEAIEPHLPDAADPLLRRLGDEPRRRLADLFPQLGDGAPAVAPVSATERWSLHRAVRDLLDLLASRRPFVLAIDDLHWADPTTTELLDHLARRPPRGRHLVIVASRPDPQCDRLLAARRPSGPGAAVLLDLRPLDRDEAEALLAPIDDLQRRDDIFASSGGNPLLLAELVRGRGSADVPGGIAAAVRGEIDALPAGPRALLDAAAVVGDPFDLDLAGAVAGLDDDGVLAALDVLAAHRLVRPADDPRRFAFRHPVIRTAVYAALPPGTRLARHAGAAAELARAGAPAAAQARHLLHTATPDDRAAAMTLRHGAAAVRAQAPAIAADWLMAAQRADPAQDAAALDTLAAVLVEAGRLDEALAVIDAALGLCGAGEDAVRVSLSVRAARGLRRLGRHDDSARHLQDALAHAGVADGSRALLETEFAASAYFAGRYDVMGERAERAWALRDAGDLVVFAAAAAMVSATRAFRGDRAAAVQAADAAVTSIAAAGDPELAAGAESALVVAWALIAQERLADALAIARRAAGASRRGGGGPAAAELDLTCALALGLTGRIEAAVDAADRAEHAARVSGLAQPLQWALWMRGWTLLEQGDLDAALAAAGESLELAERLDDSALIGVARAVTGAVLIARGEPDGGRRAIESATGAVDPAWACRWTPWLVEADIALGDLPGAAAHVERAVDLAAALGLAGAGAAVARAQARLALAEGDLRRALGHARSALADAQRVGGAVDVARAHLLVGRALAGTDRRGALEALEAAEQGAAAAGAQRLRQEARRELRRSGRRVGSGGRRGRGDSGEPSLSDREREVAELVATGATNREIGDRLFLSEKTVETHLSSVFRKLSVRSRAEVAARIAAGRVD
jgi:DNA-binding CsgD family transcriptional regulator/tetratricopeptide (TPR) repeat protein